MRKLIGSLKMHVGKSSARNQSLGENIEVRALIWQDLKDYMRQAGEVTYADAHNEIRGEGIVEFASRKDMDKALDMLDGCEFNGKNITLIREKDRRYPDLLTK